ncbi:MAG TPA: histidinol-phosphate transaminase [Verrucomicrobiae bacterium]|nr:histidinol-phosphate transaminase [Verrucomicrobiae bacterium]
MKLNRRQWLANVAVSATALSVVPRTALSQHRRVQSDFIKLDQNENPYGISTKVEEAITSAVGQSNRYPLRELAALRDLIAEREQVSNECVLMGGGCTELFSLACLAYGGSGKQVLAAEPTYSGFVSYVERIGGRLVRVPVNKRWETDLDAMTAQANGTNLVYICNPNNPTGTIVDGAKLRDFCAEQARQRIVLVDEAYYELVEDGRRISMVELVRQNANVIVVRTFSKIFGLAGLRVGYAIARPDLIAELRRWQTTFCAVNRLGIVAARVAYVDSEHIALSRKRIAEARQQLYPVLEQLGHKPILSSQANFIAFEAKSGSPQLISRLRTGYNIGVRPFEFLGKSWVRVSMGTKEEMETVAAALRDIG